MIQIEDPALITINEYQDENKGVDAQKFDRRIVRESDIPLEAIYNRKVEAFKKIESLSCISPSPFTIQIQKRYDGNPDHTLIRIHHIDKNSMIEHKYNEYYTKKVY